MIIFITELHNKPQGCGASVASAAGPFTTKKNREFSNEWEGQIPFTLCLNGKPVCLNCSGASTYI
jgi:hypothetical protein